MVAVLRNSSDDGISKDNMEPKSEQPCQPGGLVTDLGAALNGT